MSNDKPAAQSTAKTPYEAIGGEDSVRILVQRFYTLMDTLPEAAGIRKMHAPSLSGSAEKLFMYLSGWLGGPPLYEEKFGHPRLRSRHLHFSIGTSEAEQWMLCMRQAMAECIDDANIRADLDKKLTDLAMFMRNK